MIEFCISIRATKNPAVDPARTGSSPFGCNVVSKANTTLASNAREAPANIDAIPTRAATRMSNPAWGKIAITPAPASAPLPPPIVINGARVPPEVPLLSAIDHEMNFITHRNATSFSGRLLEMISVMLL